MSTTTTTGPASPASPAHEHLERRYVWDGLLRTVHWTLMLSIGVLTVTGLYIAHPVVAAPGPAGERFVMGWMRHVHFFSAMAFSLALAARLVWFVMGPTHARLGELVPTSRHRLRELWAVIKYYAWPRGGPPPHEGHNPLAGLSYLGFYGLSLLMTVTGFVLYSVSAPLGSPLRPLLALLPWLGGAQTVRLLHHVTMWLTLVFAMVHVYLVVFNARAQKSGLIDSMVTGYKVLDESAPHGH
jgi:Ni/Fe-hydrogenase 1 B-type cytochrome subunit